jgi:16S rRNA C1402 (ribose-2'-O) methylase RsmI
VFEERTAGRLQELAAVFAGQEIKGEITVLIAGASELAAWTEEQMSIYLDRELQISSQPLSALAADLARVSGWPRKKVYDFVLKRQRQSVHSD